MTWPRADSLSPTADVTWVTSDQVGYEPAPPAPPAPPSLEGYLDLIPAMNRGMPRFTSMIEAELAPVVAAQETILHLTVDFDLDVAVGAQLDVDGEWIGRTRYVNVPIAGVFFTFDDSARGFDQGIWYQSQYAVAGGITRLDDETYRTLLRAKIAANHWDGTLPGAQAALSIMFPAGETRAFIIDNQDMSMTFAVSGKVPSLLFIALLSQGYIPLKPEGVRANYVVTTAEGPLFGFDVQNEFISGLDTGAWGADPSYFTS